MSLGDIISSCGHAFNGRPLAPTVVVEAVAGAARMTFKGANDAGSLLREVDIGGGESAAFDCRGLCLISIEITDIAGPGEDLGPKISMLWHEGCRSKTHYRRTQALKAYELVVVPRGATFVILHAPDSTFSWSRYLDGGHSTHALEANLPHRILGDMAVPSQDITVTWLLEPV